MLRSLVGSEMCIRDRFGSWGDVDEEEEEYDAAAWILRSRSSLTRAERVDRPELAKPDTMISAMSDDALQRYRCAKQNNRPPRGCSAENTAANNHLLQVNQVSSEQIPAPLLWWTLSLSRDDIRNDGGALTVFPSFFGLFRRKDRLAKPPLATELDGILNCAACPRAYERRCARRPIIASSSPLEASVRPTDFLSPASSSGFRILNTSRVHCYCFPASRGSHWFEMKITTNFAANSSENTNGA